MSGIFPLRKGATFERRVASLFSKRFAEYLGVEKGFLRNTTSGSRFGGKNAPLMEQVVQQRRDTGDILTPVKFRFSVECKCYADALNVVTWMRGCAKWDKWLSQAALCDDSRYPLLVIKYNNCDEIVFVGEEVWNDIRNDDSFFNCFFYRDNCGRYWRGMLLDDFFKLRDDAYFYTVGE